MSSPMPPARLPRGDTQPSRVVSLPTALPPRPPESPLPGSLPPSERRRFGRLIGESMTMRRAFAVLERVSPTNASLLIEGETGSGKELCAEAVHNHSQRRGKPFVVADLGAMPPSLIESELFGHVRGAFTGAMRDRPGAFERAHTGTLFLDEVGELSPEVQPRLLRAIESGQVKRVGADDYRVVDVRIIAATHRGLREQVRANRFRADLYHRLAVVRVQLPPLRERPEDVPPLVESILASMGEDPTLSAQLLPLLHGHDWPGNVRELRNVVARACALWQDGAEPPPDLLGTNEPRLQEGPPWPLHLPFKEAKERLLSAFERDYLAGIMDRCRGNISEAARQADIDRVYLYRLLRKHGMRGATGPEPEPVPPPEPDPGEAA